MVLIHYKPVTSSLRGSVLVKKSLLHKGRSLKALTLSKKKSGGRNNLGRITSANRGGGHKQKLRVIDFKRSLSGKGTVQRIEYDPNRTTFIALVLYSNNEYAYILAPSGLSVGDAVFSGDDVEISNGNCLPLHSIPIGTNIHNVEMKPGKGGQIARSAGSCAVLLSKVGGYARIKMVSGEIRILHLNCKATIGVLSNSDHKNIKIGKAGRNRWLNKRPVVRGVAKNPVDHPHGGGEGKTSGGRHPVTPWGKCTKGKKTRVRNKNSNKFIIKRRK